MPLVLLHLLLDVPTTSCTLRGPQRPRTPPSLPHHAERLSPPPSPPRRPATAAVALPLLTRATWAPEDRARPASGEETPAPTFVARRAPCSLLGGSSRAGPAGRNGREGTGSLCAATSRGLLHVSLQQRARDPEVRRAGGNATPEGFVDATHNVTGHVRTLRSMSRPERFLADLLDKPLHHLCPRLQHESVFVLAVC